MRNEQDILIDIPIEQIQLFPQEVIEKTREVRPRLLASPEWIKENTLSGTINANDPDVYRFLREGAKASELFVLYPR